MLVSPNSVIALPEHQKDGLSTTIIQQAGSVLIQAEKRNVKHFQVETPYLAAVVKGTQFRVSVNAVGSTVEVIEGRVEVAEFKSGQFALVLPGSGSESRRVRRRRPDLERPGQAQPNRKGNAAPVTVRARSRAKRRPSDAWRHRQWKICPRPRRHQCSQRSLRVHRHGPCAQCSANQRAAW